MNAGQIRLRAVTAEDSALLFSLYASTREQELAHLPLDSAQKAAFLQMQFNAQRRWYETAYPGADHQIIVIDETSAGRILVHSSPDRLQLVDIVLAPEVRNHGVGSQLLKSLIARAESLRVPLGLQVLATNFGALKLYQRLGFTVIKTTQMYLEMEYRAAAPVRPEEIYLRPAVDHDAEFLLSLYASTRAQELAQVPWTAEQKDAFLRMQFAAQKQHYSAEHPAAVQSLIYAGSQPSGRIYLDRSATEFHILDITIAPAMRNRGIGAIVLRQLMEEAGEAGKPVTIYVESYNPSLKFFERLGFAKAEEKGLHFLMKWTG